MASAGFGEHLRREREMRGVSLEEIAGATRISTRFLEALEKEAWDRLPGGVFNRGFVRTIARFLGLEEESLLAEYSMAKGEANAPPPVPADLSAQPFAARQQPAAARQSSASGQSTRKISWIALAALPIVLALGAAGWFAWQKIETRRAELNTAANSLPAPPLPPSAPSTLWNPEDSAAPAADDPPAPASPWSAAPGDLRLKIDADRNTVLTVTSDGQPVFAGAIAAGESRSIAARTSLILEAQDAGAVRLELNGQALHPIGPSGQPGKITLGNPGTPSDAGGHD